MRLSIALLISIFLHLILFLPLGVKINSSSTPEKFLVVERFGGLLDRSGGPGDPSSSQGHNSLGREGTIDKILEGNPKPPYPMAARRMRLEGTAIVQILISESGEIKNIVFKSGTGH